jgi:hypothetical protein
VTVTSFVRHCVQPSDGCTAMLVVKRLRRYIKYKYGFGALVEIHCPRHGSAIFAVTTYCIARLCECALSHQTHLSSRGRNLEILGETEKMTCDHYYVVAYSDMYVLIDTTQQQNLDKRHGCMLSHFAASEVTQ